FSTRSKIGAIMSAMSPSARPTTERHTTPATSRILYGLTYRSNLQNSWPCVKETLDPSFSGLHAALEAFPVKVARAPDENPTPVADFGTLRTAHQFVKPPPQGGFLELGHASCRSSRVCGFSDP